MEIDVKQVLLQALNFGILIVVLNKFLYKPVLKILNQREEKINDGMRAAEKNLKVEEELEKKEKAALAKARREANKIITDAKSDAKKQAAVIVKEAKDKAKEEAAKQEKKLESELESQKKAMKNDLAKLVVATVETVLEDSLTDKDVERITKSAVKNL